MTNENKCKYNTPWTVCQQKNGMFRVINTERTVANYLYDHEADLIAAVPEMLEWLEGHIKRVCVECPFDTCYGCVSNEAKRIIAKAKGKRNNSNSNTDDNDNRKID